ncbi:MAG TPA: hypothetical protein VGP07_24730 [Polyangia bacterium]|jgi:hypothetical protein
MSAPDVILRALRARLHAEGLHIVLPLSGRAFDESCATSGGARARAWLPDAAGAVLIGDGGPRFFARFRAMRAPDTSSEALNPLDDFTRRRVESAVTDVLGPAGLPHRLLYPFGDGTAPLPFQRLGQAAGLPAPGPLGIQLHPDFGPWWAYRALVIMPLPLETELPLTASCPPCDRPCVRGCPTHASERGALPTCGDLCGARLRCPIGSAQRYPADQIAFHGRAREAMMRAHATRGSRDPA